jgi:AraC-like DNA-binding protein
MNSQPDQQLVKLLQNSNFSEVFVTICVSSGDINAILPFLLDHDIPFAMSSIGQKTKANMVVTDTSVVLKTPQNHDSVKVNCANKLEGIYQKYIVDGIINIPPAQDEIAAELGITVVAFKNHFRRLYGKPFYQLYLEKKMEYAAQLLKQGYRASQVSVMVGYGEKSCIKFNKIFQKHYGQTPKKYQMGGFKNVNSPKK